MALCRKCGKRREGKSFTTNTPGGTPRRTCLMCRNKRRRTLYPGRYGKIRASHKKWVDGHPDYDIKKRYGITWGEYDKLFRKQRGRCAICRKPPNPNSRRKRLSVDHCHATKKVRGLLCSLCNCMVGRLKEDPKKFDRAIRYLEGRLYAIV